MLLKKDLFSDFEMLEICRQIIDEDYTQQVHTGRDETQNIENHYIT